MAESVTILDPKGVARAIPADQVDAALASGGKRAVKMTDPKGTARWVSEDKVQEATAAGGKPVSEAVLPTWTQRLFGPNVSATTPLLNTDALRNVGKHLVGAVTGPLHAALDQPETGQEAVAALGGPGTLAADRMLVKPTTDALTQARNQWKAKNFGLGLKPEYDAQGNYQPSVASSLIDAIPVVGPFARNIDNEAHKEGALPALAGALTDVAAPELAEKGIANLPAPAAIKRRFLAPAKTVDTTIPGDTVTPRQRFMDARKQGVNLDTAQATGGKVASVAKKVSEHSLTGSSKFADNTAANVTALEDHAKGLVDGITPDKMSREDFGSAVQTALRQHQEHLNNQAGEVFDDLTQRYKDVQPDLSDVRKQAQQIVDANAGYYKNHPEMLSGQPGRAWSIVNRLAEEPAAPPPKTVTSPILNADGKPITSTTQEPAPKSDTWTDLHKLRSDLMNMYRSPDIVGSNAEGWLKQLTGKVDGAMTEAASGLSPADQGNFRYANDIYKRMKETYDNPQSKLFHIVRAPDGLTAANSLANVTPHVAGQIGQASVDLGIPELQQQLQRQTVERLLDPAGNGTPDLKGLPTRFSRAQKEALGGTLTPSQIGDVEKLARTSKVVHADSNPSGTAKTMQPAAETGAMVTGAGTLATGLATGNPALMAAGAAPFVEAGATRVAASKMTNPEFNEDLMRTPPPPKPTATSPVPPSAITALGNATQPDDTSKPTHPAGEVTAFDHDTGLPIVKRGGGGDTPALDKPADSTATAEHPDTHVFSKTQFAQASPQADADAAAKAAADEGFEVQE